MKKLKKYKLLKWYPGCEGLKEGQVVCKYPGITCYYQTKMSVLLFSPTQVEENPDFWQEIFEKDYEILSFIKNSFSAKGYIKTRNADGKFIWELTNTLDIEERLLDSDKFDIHSVKRLSDGKVFTIGDEIKTCVSDTYASIYGFKIVNNSLQINHTHAYLLDKQYPKTPSGCHLYLISKKKKSLFTTEDGVEVIPKENGEFRYWSLKLNNWKISAAPHILNSNKIIPIPTEELLRCCNELRFSSKEAAEEYVLMNRKEFSINDFEKLGADKELINQAKILLNEKL